jgi:hypothetical protein
MQGHLEITLVGETESRAWGRDIPSVPLAIVAGCMLAGAAYAYAVGDDTNWDWRNYHAYNVWATINRRYETDVIPPGFQTYFNPLIYYPIYVLRQLLSPLWAGLIAGAAHGLNLVAIYSLTRALLGSAANAACLAASVLLAAFGPMTLSEVGTSFADIVLSLPIIAALIFITSSDEMRPRFYILAGVLIGASVALKLTNVVFALGLLMATIAARRPLAALGCVVLGGAIGSLLAGGWWSFLLWRDFGNPVFPLFNAVFPSPELPPINILDRQFVPHGWLDGLAYPFYWLAGDNRTSEYAFRDARFAAALILFAVAIGASLIRRAALFTHRDVQFIIFFAVSYVTWLMLFSIQRYVVALELLCGPLIVLLLVRILQHAGFDGSSIGLERWRSVIILIVALASAAWTQPGDWTRRAWSNPYRPQLPTELTQPAIYLLLDKPLSYIALLLPPRSRFYQLADLALPIVANGRLDSRIRAGLQDRLPGGIWELHLRGTPIRKELLDPYGLMIDGSRSCVEIEGANPGAVIEACPAIERKRHP